MNNNPLLAERLVGIHGLGHLLQGVNIQSVSIISMFEFSI